MLHVARAISDIVGTAQTIVFHDTSNSEVRAVTDMGQSLWLEGATAGRKVPAIEEPIDCSNRPPENFDCTIADRHNLDSVDIGLGHTSTEHSELSKAVAGMCYRTRLQVASARYSLRCVEDSHEKHSKVDAATAGIWVSDTEQRIRHIQAVAGPGLGCKSLAGREYRDRC